MEISIIITNYNYGDYIERCIRSCISQKMTAGKGFEVIVVDDNSTDHSRKILENYSDNIECILLDENKGVAVAANEGIQHAKGRFIVRVDSDDYINENMIMIQSLFLNTRSEYLGVSVDYLEVDKDGDKKLGYFSALDEPVSCGIMYRKDLLIKEGLYNPEYRHREEKELRYRLQDKYTIGNIPIPLYRYRKHGENKTENKIELDQVDNSLDQKYKKINK
jgi:glycosyltransferase involved in cell wall biosynthesis